ncbi:MAG: adenine phosphoribosyltransferase [Planctomycetes bacterium]|nr:adenine phosphoribosyltransferase [Planctomycetota bacterium]
MDFDFDRHIRKVPDFPKPGILFYDITSLTADPEAFAAIQQGMDEAFCPSEYDALLAVESRGFLFAAAAAFRLKKPLFLARKKGKLPNACLSMNYKLEYGEATLEIQECDLEQGGRWLIVDDLIATGGTLRAVCDMVSTRDVSVAGIFAVIGLPFLGFEDQLKGTKVRTLIDYHDE